MSKIYQNVTSSIDYLVNNKNFDKTTINEKCFYEKTYLDLINAYSDLVAIGRDSNGKRLYNLNTSFDEFLEYNRIDYSICTYLHVLIGAYEKMLKNFLMHKYCSKMVAVGDLEVKDYSWIDNYLIGNQVFDILPIDTVFYEGFELTSGEDDVKKRTDTLNNLKNIVSTVPEYGIQKHYYDKYGFIPFYIAIHSLYLSDLLILFSLLPKRDKEELMRVFNGASPSKNYNDNEVYKFEQDASRIKWVRNIVNHYEPFIPFLNGSSMNSINDLCNIFKKLKKYYSSVVSLPQITFTETKTYKSKSKYSRNYHLKVEMVMNSLR